MCYGGVGNATDVCVACVRIAVCWARLNGGDCPCSDLAGEHDSMCCAVGCDVWD